MTAIVYEGDFIRDRMDNGTIRQVSYIVDMTLYMEDGGVMGLDEVQHDDIILESEMYG